MPGPDNRRLPDTLLQPQTRSQLGAYHRRRRQRVIVVTVAVALSVTALAAVVAGVARSSRSDAGSTKGSTAQGSVSTTGTLGSAATSVSAGVSAGSVSSPTSRTDTRVIEIGWVGDLTPGSKYGNPPRNGRALFKPTRKYTLEPDVMVANLEGTFGTGGRSKCDGRDSKVCFAFQAPPENAAALAWAGIDVVNLANNHSYDYLARGLDSTRKALDANEIAYTGLVDTVAVKEVDGVRIAFLGFSPYVWSPGIGKIKAAKKLVRAAGEDADIVVVLMHAGAEGADKTSTPQGAERAYGEFRGDTRAFSHAVIDAGADLVLGSGPHVIRGMEEYQGRLVAYSLGNFAGWRNFGRSGRLALSGLLTVRLAEDGRVLGGRWRSLRIAEPGVPKVDPDHESAALAGRLSKKDFETPVELEENGDFTLSGQ